MRRPGIEPGSQEWESCMIPLHQRRNLTTKAKFRRTTHINLKFINNHKFSHNVCLPKNY